MSRQNLSYQKSIPMSITSTNNQDNQASPDFDQPNPIDQLNFISAIEIIPDPAFQIKGQMRITINEAEIFSTKSLPAGFFRRYSLFSIPIGFRALERWGHVKIFIWNGSGDSSQVQIHGTLIISD